MNEDDLSWMTPERVETICEILYATIQFYNGHGKKANNTYINYIRQNLNHARNGLDIENLVITNQKEGKINE